MLAYRFYPGSSGANLIADTSRPMGEASLVWAERVLSYGDGGPGTVLALRCWGILLDEVDRCRDVPGVAGEGGGVIAYPSGPGRQAGPLG